MKVIKESIGNVTIFIQTIDDALEIVGGETKDGRSTNLTGIEETVQAAYTQVKSVIKGIAQDIGAELKSIRAPARPKQVEMEFSVGVSAQAGPIWVLCGTGEYALKVKMTWELGTDEQPT